MPSKLKSRKFWVAVSMATFVILSEGLGFDLSESAFTSLAGIVIAYLVAQGYVDGQGMGGDE